MKKLVLKLAIIFTLVLFLGCKTDVSRTAPDTGTGSGGIGDFGGYGSLTIANKSSTELQDFRYSGETIQGFNNIIHRHGTGTFLVAESSDDYIYFGVKNIITNTIYNVRTEEKVSCKKTLVYTISDGTIVRVDALNGKIKLSDLFRNPDPSRYIISDTPAPKPEPTPTYDTSLTVKNQSSDSLSNIIFNGKQWEEVKPGYSCKLEFDTKEQGYLYFTIGSQRYKTKVVITVEKGKHETFNFLDTTPKEKIKS